MKELEEARRARAELDKAIATMEAKQKDATWPKDGETYWYISGCGLVDHSIWSGGNFGKGALSIGNVFRTESDAKKELETRKTIAEFRAQPGRKNICSGGKCHSVTVSHKSGEVSLDCWEYTDTGFASTYFDSRESAQAAIKAVGEDRLLAASKWLSMGE